MFRVVDEEMKIDVKDAILWIDIYCYSCRRLIALSYTTEFDGRRYCDKCFGAGNLKIIKESEK